MSHTPTARPLAANELPPVPWTAAYVDLLFAFGQGISAGVITLIAFVCFGAAYLTLPENTGTVGAALVCNLPGSSGGAVECLEAVLPAVPHALELLAGGRPH